MKRDFPLITLILLFFLASLTATTTAWLITAKVTENRLRELFYLDNNNISTQINNRFNTYLDILTGIQAFVENSNIVTYAEWKDYINRIQITQKYPSLRSTIYIQKVSTANKDSFIKKLKRENLDNPAYASYAIRAIDPNYQKDQEDYFPVVYTEGPNREERLTALGLDISSEKKRAEALFAARDSNRPTTTPPIRFVIRPYNTGFSLTFPIYQKELPLDTVKQLRQAFIGAVYAPFDINQFFDAILKPGNRDAYPHLDLEVYEPKSERPNELLYDKNQSISLSRDPSHYAFTTKQTISLPNRRWEIAIGIPKKFVAATYWASIPLTILIGGVLASIASFSFLFYQYRQLQIQTSR